MPQDNDHKLPHMKYSIKTDFPSSNSANEQLLSKKVRNWTYQNNYFN